MANASVTINGISKTATATTHGTLVAMVTPTTNAVPRLNIPLRNQKFSAGENITLKGGEVITTSMS